MAMGKLCNSCQHVNHTKSTECEVCSYNLSSAPQAVYDGEKEPNVTTAATTPEPAGRKNATLLHGFGVFSILAGIVGGISVTVMYSKMVIIDPQYTAIVVTKEVNNPVAYLWGFSVFISGVAWGLIMTTLANTFGDVTEIKAILKGKELK